MFQSAMRDGLRSVQNFGGDDLLAALGLQRRRDFSDVLLPSIALFAAGAVVGAATAMLFAPKPGYVIRRDLTEGAKGLGQRLGSTASSVIQDVREALPLINDDDKKPASGPNSQSARRA